jgi:predicted small secreted protein
VIKQAALTGVLLLLIALLLSACATSGEEATTTGSTSESTATVPGEKMSDEGRVTPGAAGSSASVHW